MTAANGRRVTTLQTDPPCKGLDPDTDPCPYCGAWLAEPCGWKPPPPQPADRVPELEPAPCVRGADPCPYCGAPLAEPCRWP